MADFNIAYKKTAAIEGGYANNSNDRGGETYKGIARKIHPDWKGWTFIDGIKASFGTSAQVINQQAAKNLSLQALVNHFYKVNFWDALNLDSLNSQRVANELYDTAVNMGTGRAGLFFQRCLLVSTRDYLKLDGQVGNKTISVFNELSETDKYMVWKLFNCLQGERYISICEADPTQEIFMRSWASRVFEN